MKVQALLAHIFYIAKDVNHLPLFSDQSTINYMITSTLQNEANTRSEANGMPKCFRELSKFADHWNAGRHVFSL